MCYRWEQGKNLSRNNAPQTSIRGTLAPARNLSVFPAEEQREINCVCLKSVALMEGGEIMGHLSGAVAGEGFLCLRAAI